MEKDIIIEPDLKIVNGDIAVEDCQSQNIKFLLLTIPGSIYLQPIIGGALCRMQNQSTGDYRFITSIINDVLSIDGYVNVRILNRENGLFIEAEK